MSGSQSGQGGLEDAVGVEIAMSSSNPPLLAEAHSFEQTLLGPFQIPGYIVSNLALSGYIILAEFD